MTDEERERVLGECLESFHRRRALGEHPKAEEFRERAGEAYDELLHILDVEAQFDQAIEPRAAAAFPRSFGEYTLLRELGRGAMGVVFEAVHRSLGRKVALKVLRTGFDTNDEARERFRREARACAQIRHDNIVQIYDAGEVDGQPWYSMALLDGRSLHDLAREKQLPPPRELARRVADVADALDALHRAGVVHRDIKPSNILAEPGGRMVLADFGLARTTAERLTATGQALGTPLYMSPEQVLGRTQDIDGRSDVYGLGATLYELLTGRPMFAADQPVAILRMILKERPAAPRDVRPEIDQALENVVLKAIEKEKTDRYATAADLRDDLRAYASDGDVKGRPVSLTRLRLRRLLRRWPFGFAAAAVLGAAAYAWNTRPGSIEIARSIPVADVLLDGKLMGRPRITFTASPGDHELVLREPGFRDSHRWLHVAPGGVATLEPVLAPLDPDDDAALRRIAEGLQIPLASFDAPSGTRGGGDASALPLLPRGAVRLEDAGEWVVEVGADFESGGKLVFRSGDRTLHEEAFEPKRLGEARGTMPTEAVDAVRRGETVAWGWVPPHGEARMATVWAAGATDGLVAHAARPVLDDFTAADAPDVFRLIEAQRLLDAGLLTAAHRLAAEHVAAHPRNARGWVLLFESLRRAGLEESAAAGRARGYALPAAARAAVLRAK